MPPIFYYILLLSFREAVSGTKYSCSRLKPKYLLPPKYLMPTQIFGLAMLLPVGMIEERPAARGETGN